MHVDQIIVKAHQHANSILRCFVSRDRNTLVRAFVTYVRPLVEYNSVVWSPYLKQDIDRIERVQRCFTKRLRGLKNFSYKDRLRLLNLASLEARRVRTDLLWCYKIVFGLTVLRFDDFFQWSTARQTRGHPYKLYKRLNTCTPRVMYFSERIVNLWNQLPLDCIDFNSFASFKRTLSAFDLSSFLRCF